MIAASTWPSWFASELRELTGRTFELREQVRFDLDSREGPGATILSDPRRCGGRVMTRPSSLATYPMWSGLASTGYKRVNGNPSRSYRTVLIAF